MMAQGKRMDDDVRFLSGSLEEQRITVRKEDLTSLSPKECPIRKPLWIEDGLSNPPDWRLDKNQ